MGYFQQALFNYYGKSQSSYFSFLVLINALRKPTDEKTNSLNESISLTRQYSLFNKDIYFYLILSEFSRFFLAHFLKSFTR